MRTAPGRAFDARESTSDDGKTWLVTHPVPDTPALPRPAMPALGPPSAIAPVFEVESQQPGYFFLYVQDGMGLVSSFSKRATFASSSRTFESKGFRSIGFTPKPTP